MGQIGEPLREVEAPAPVRRTAPTEQPRTPTPQPTREAPEREPERVPA